MTQQSNEPVDVPDEDQWPEGESPYDEDVKVQDNDTPAEED